MDRFPRTRFPQKGLQSDSSVVSGSPTWVITRIEGSHSDGTARFFQTIIKEGGMGRNGPIPFIRIVLPSSTGVNFTQVRQLLSERFVKTSWLGQWLKFHWECRGEIPGSTKYRIRTKMVYGMFSLHWNSASENKTYANDNTFLRVSLDTWVCEETILLFIISNCRQTFNISRALVSNKIIDHSDVYLHFDLTFNSKLCFAA